MALGSGKIWKIVVANRNWLIMPGTAVDRAAALEIREQLYCNELGYRWESREDRFDAHAAIAVIRTDYGRAIGSIRVVGPEVRPFEIEKYLSIADILPADARPAEVNRYCVVPEFRGVASFVHFATFRFTIEYAQQEHFSHFVIATKPAIEPIYRYLQFERVPGRSFHHLELGGSVHNLMILDLRHLAARYRRARHPFSKLLPSSKQ
jgi:N-acyl-L-homoserine lactone synthetase